MFSGTQKVSIRIWAIVKRSIALWVWDVCVMFDAWNVNYGRERFVAVIDGGSSSVSSDLPMKIGIRAIHDSIIVMTKLETQPTRFN